MKLTEKNRKALEDALVVLNAYRYIDPNMSRQAFEFQRFKAKEFLKVHGETIGNTFTLLLEIWEPLEHTEKCETAIDDVLIFEDIKDNLLRNRLRTAANNLAAIRKVVGGGAVREHIHDWEAGSWGVIIGVSKCKECGKISSTKDFKRLRESDRNPEGLYHVEESRDE